MAVEFDIFKLPQKWFALDYTEMFVSLLPDGLIWVFDKWMLGTVVQDVLGSGDTSWQDDFTSLEEVQDIILGEGGEGNVLRRILSCFGSELERLESSAWALINQTDPGVAVELLEPWERQLGLPEDCYNDIPLTTDERQRQAHAKLFDAFKTTTFQFYEDYAATLGFDVTVEEIPESSQPRIMGVAIMGVEPMGGYGGNSVLQITINSGTSDNELLKCALEKVKQAHVVIRWVE